MKQHQVDDALARKDEANAAIDRAVKALSAVDIMTIKRADDAVVEAFIASIRSCFETFEPDMDGWIADYQRRKEEENE